MSLGSDGRPSSWAFALVHGIGAAQPLDMIQDVSDAIRKPRPSLELRSGAEVHEVKEPDPDQPERQRTRHIVIRHGGIAGDPGTKVRFGTAHWADITYYRQGFLALIGSILMTAFGVRFFAEAAAGDAEGASTIERGLSTMLRFILRFMVWFLAVVVFPVTFVALVFSGTGLVAEYAIRDRIGFGGVQFVDLQRWFILLVGGGGCIACAGIGLKRVKPMSHERPLGKPIFYAIAWIAFAICVVLILHNHRVDWTVWLGAPGQKCGLLRDCLRENLMVIASYTNPFLAQRINLVDGIGVAFALLHLAQVTTGAVMLGLISATLMVLAAFALTTLLAGRTPYSAMFAAVSTVTIWIVLLIVLWPENLMTYSAMGRYIRLEGPTEVTAMFLRWETWPAQGLEFYTSKVPVMPDGTGLRTLREYYPIQWFEATYFAFLCLATAVLCLLLFSRWLSRKLRSKAHLDSFRVAAGACRPACENWPRLIIAQLYIGLVVLLMFFASAVALSHSLKLEPWLLDLVGIGAPERKAPPEVFFHAEWIRLMVIASALFFLFLSHRILDGIRLVLDVVNHFAQPGDDYPVRRRIENRFGEIIEHLLAPGDKPNLVIIAHSQGTVITLDALLRDGWVADVLKRASTLTVITLGSPITHVYQNYFPGPYRELADTSLAALGNEPRFRWVNAYRIDDYVGTYIENSIPTIPVNVPLPVGGHTDYWTGEVMCRVLAEPILHDFILPAMRQESTHPLVSEP